MPTWVLDVVLILLASWFFAKRMFPAKQVKRISTNELKINPKGSR